MSHRVLIGLVAALFVTSAQAQTVNLKVLGQPVGSGLIQKNKEQPFFEAFAAKSGLNASVQYIPVDVAGIPDTDGLRALKSGLFDIVSIRGPQVSRDEPTILGFDLIGLNPTFEAGEKHTKAFFAVVDKRLQSQFNAKLLGVWPAGPQVIFCKPKIKGLADLKGLKVRVGDQSAATFVAGLGATGVPMPFGEVQQSLARGVVDCAITGPASANSGGWPEATTTVLPIALQLAINGYAINLDRWNKLSTEDRAKLQKSIEALTADIWVYSKELYEDAMRCNTGATPCTQGKPYKLAAVPVTEPDLATVKAALTERSLPVWAKQCNAVNPTCEADWKATIGAALGL
jgi:TRAP-type C4-dicarboxylate transport system substrate-binding protein